MAHSQPTPRCSYSCSSRLALSLWLPTSAFILSWWNAQRATVMTPIIDTPSVNSDREHVLERNAVAAEQQRAADPAGEGDHPRHRTLRHHDQAEPATPSPAMTEAAITCVPGSRVGKR